jgi:hypothetical protein
MSTADYFKYLGCISFWETRKIRGVMAPFFWAYNLKCDMKIAGYKRKLKALKVIPLDIRLIK